MPVPSAPLLELTATTRAAIIASLLVVPTLAGLWPIARLLASPIAYEAFTAAIVSGVILAGGVLLVAIGIYSLLFYPLVRLQKK